MIWLRSSECLEMEITVEEESIPRDNTQSYTRSYIFKYNNTYASAEAVITLVLNRSQSKSQIVPL